MKRRISLVVAAAVVAMSALMFGPSAVAVTVRQPATFLYLESDAGDPIGNGMTHLMTGEVFFDQTAHALWVRMVKGDRHANVFIDAPHDQPVVKGRFVARAGGEADNEFHNFMIHVSSGENCGMADGVVDIRQWERTKSGRTKRFDMTFDVRCFGHGTGAARGRLAFNSTLKTVAPRSPAVLRGGERIWEGYSLTNAQGAVGPPYADKIYQQAKLSGGQLMTLRRVWDGTPDYGYRDEVAWATPTAESDARQLVLRTNGSLALLSPWDDVIWSIKPKGTGRGAFLMVTRDGELVLYNSRYKPIWTAGS